MFEKYYSCKCHCASVLSVKCVMAQYYSGTPLKHFVPYSKVFLTQQLKVYFW